MQFKLVYLFYLKILEKQLTQPLNLFFKKSLLNLVLPTVSSTVIRNLIIQLISGSTWQQNLLNLTILLKFVLRWPFWTSRSHFKDWMIRCSTLLWSYKSQLRRNRNKEISNSSSRIRTSKRQQKIWFWSWWVQPKEICWIMKNWSTHWKTQRKKRQKSLKRCRGSNISEHSLTVSGTSTRKFQREFPTYISLHLTWPTLNQHISGHLNSTSTYSRDPLKSLFLAKKIVARTSSTSSRLSFTSPYVEVCWKRTKLFSPSWFTSKLWLPKRKSLTQKSGLWWLEVHGFSLASQFLMVWSGSRTKPGQPFVNSLKL